MRRVEKTNKGGGGALPYVPGFISDVDMLELKRDVEAEFRKLAQAVDALMLENAELRKLIEGKK